MPVIQGLSKKPWIYRRVFLRGMDVIPESIEDAKKNAARHEIKHAKYVTGKAEVLLPKWTKEGWNPDVVIVDPPRTGLDGQLFNSV